MESSSHRPYSVALLTFTFVLIPTALVGQQQRRSFWRIEAGRADIHRASSSGAAVALRVGRGADRGGMIRLDLGASYSAADEGYLTLELGAEMLLLTRARATPVAGVGVGLLTEPEFTGAMIRGMLAVDVAVGRGVAMRLGAQFGTHEGTRGPNVFFGGLEFRGHPR